MTDDVIDDTHLAIIGMACRFPGADTPAAFWANLDAGVDSVRAFTDTELDEWSGGRTRPTDPRYVVMHGAVDGVGQFDADFFGYSARDAAMLNPQHQMFLECAWEALERAGYDPLAVPGTVGVYAGAGRNGYASAIRANADRFPGVDEFAINLANEPDHLCARVAYKLGLTGPTVTVLTACSTSLVAVHEAGRSLLAGDCDVALAGGVTVRLPRVGYWHQDNGVMSPDGHCHTFSADAKGIVAGDGAGVVVLRRLRDAIDDGDPVLAVIRGTAVNNDGRRRPGFTTPSVQGQAEVIRTALATADVLPETISYVEAHGTGTPVGDPIEITALSQVFDGLPPASVAIGSVKTNLGHTDTAAGVASLIKTVLALSHRRLPPSLYFTGPNPEIDFASTPFRVNTESRPWDSPDGRPRRAGISSFGVGGVNAHVVVEEAPPLRSSPAAGGSQLLVLSARTPSALSAMADATVAHLRSFPQPRIDEVARTLQTGRHEFPYRAHLVWTPQTTAGSTLRFQQSTVAAGTPTVTFMFPGQGSQRPGMTRQLYALVPVFRQVVDECCDLLLPLLGRDLRELLYPTADHTELNRIEYVQPALFVIDYALAQTWLDLGVRPDAMIGHSLGELVAACLAGVMTLPAAIEVVARRAAALAEMPPGEMLAVSLPAEEIRGLVDGAGIAVAGVNGPHQCVVAGTPDLIGELREKLADVHTRPVAAEHAYHTPMMAPVAAELRKVLAGITLRPPRIPFASTISGHWITDAEATDPEFWASQVVRPVLFEPALQELLSTTEDGVLLESGPGQTLSSLATLRPKDTRRRALPALGDVTKADDEVSALLNTVGQLWQLGVSIDWERLRDGQPPLRTALPTYPFERTNHLVLPSSASVAAPQVAVSVEEPAGDTVEQQVRALYQKVLGCPEELDDPHFFEQGGDSLAAVQLTALVGEAFAVSLPLEAVFDEPSVSGLARTIEELIALVEAS